MTVSDAQRLKELEQESNKLTWRLCSQVSLSVRKRRRKRIAPTEQVVRPMATVDSLFSAPKLSVAERLMSYFTYWLETQANCDPKGKCLVVKLAAEVSDLSETMRVVLEQGTSQAISRLRDIIQEGINERSLPAHLNPQVMATTLYQLWLGASICAKISHTAAPLESALVATEELLGLPFQQSH